MFPNVVRAILCLLLWLPLAARADGRVFSHAIAVKTTIPDQRALIHFADGMETLVIETAFIGAGTNFAWVVPVPSVPKVEAMAPALFQNLELIFQPVLIHQVAHYHILILWLTVLGGLIRHHRRHGFKGCGFIFAWLLLIVFGVLFAVPMFVMGHKSAGGSTVASAVEVVERKLVGMFSTVTLSSKDGGALVSWLNDNGFITPTNVIPVITDYARQGWLFVAAKVNRDTAAVAKAMPHPLAFTFKTEKPVYPLRLTGIENGACVIELYVFGAQRAGIPHFKVEHCRAPEYPAVEGTDRFRFASFPNPEELRIRSPELRRLVKHAAVATKLTADLSPAEMTKDAFISWVPFEAALPVFYGYQAAAIWAFNLFVATTIGAWLLLGAWSKWGRAIRSIRKARAILLAGTGLMAMLTYVGLPKKDMVFFGGGLPSLGVFELLDGHIQQAAMERDRAINVGKNAGPFTFQELRRLVQKYDPQFSSLFINPYTGQPLKNEASPGNIILRKSTNGVDCVWFDIDAIEHVLATIRE